MSAAAGRGLTVRERRALSPGLVRALEAAGVQARIVDRAHPAARVAGLWRGRPPILARPGRVFWPDAPDDAAEAGPTLMGVLQHELQHLYDYACGSLSAARYLTNSRHWRYGYGLRPQSQWRDFGAEQRASIAEDYWLLSHGHAAAGATPASLADYERVLPWM